MAAITKPNEAIVITKGMTNAFIHSLANNKVNSEYWKACSSTSKKISSSTMDKLKKMCNEE